MSAAQPFRLPQGGRIDRTRALAFTFNGRPYSGYDGDTLASALLANGVRVVGRSFKFHRPRGVMTAGVEEPNALVGLETRNGTVPLARATLVPLRDGLRAVSQNCYPGVDFDFGRVFDYTHALWPASFYHKTFKWPRWETWEGLVRRAAGLGVMPKGVDPNRYFEHNLHCEVLVVGGGPAGLAAALAASRGGARVVLVEQDRELGGSLLQERALIDDAPAAEWLANVERELASIPAVRILRASVASGYYDHNVVTVVDRSSTDLTPPVKRLWKIRAREVVLAAGAIEQPLVFADNDRPNVLLAGAVRRYLARFAVAVGRRVLVATNNDDAYETAFALRDHGIDVAGVVDCRAHPAEALLAEAGRRTIPVISAAVIGGTAGDRGVRAATVYQLAEGGGTTTRGRLTIECDAIAMSGGYSPTVHLYSQAGGKLRFDDTLRCFVPASCGQRVRVAGAANGTFELDRVLEEGTRAGLEAAAAAGYAVTAPPAPARARSRPYAVAAPRRLPERSARQWIDFQYDVTAADVELAVRENYVSVEHVKRYTTVGMSVDQGKTSNLNALSLLGEITGREPGQVGTTTFRPPFAPVPMGVFAGGRSGDFFGPPRLTPLHAWHVSQGAHFEDYSGWRRPAWFRCNGATLEEALRSEVGAVRGRVGIFDGSALGKIEVRGPDALTFLDRVYANDMSTLRVGRVRYGLMLNEAGIVLDDGVLARLGEEHYLVNTSSANAARIAQWLDEWSQCEWPALELVISPVTSQWAVLTVAGPHARELLQSLDGSIDFSMAAFPHMHVRTGELLGSRVRVQRVSYSGELSYEISVPADAAEAFANELFLKGAPLGVRPYGVEAVLVLRLEKGFLHVGADTDGTTNPFDIGFGGALERKRADFIGRRWLRREAERAPGRRRLVGLEARSGEAFRAGAHFVRTEGKSQRSEGFVTSAAHSPTLDRWIGLGLLENGPERLGSTVELFDEGRTGTARVVEPVFYDAHGERMRG